MGLFLKFKKAKGLLCIEIDTYIKEASRILLGKNTIFILYDS